MTNKKTKSATKLSPYILAGLLFAGTTLVSQNETRAIGIVTNQDPQILLGGFGVYKVVTSNAKITAQQAEMNSEINRIKAEASRIGGEIQSLLGQADEVEAGRPVPMNETIYSQGRYGTADGYQNNGGASPALKDPKFRLQTSDAQELVKSLLERQDLEKAKTFSIELTRVDGTRDGRIVTVVDDLTGDLKSVAKQLVERVSSQALDTPRGSIVEVGFSWSQMSLPDPKAAKTLRLKSESMKDGHEKAKATEAVRIAEIEGKYAKALTGLKRIRLTGGGIIVGAILLGTIRSGISAEMTTLAQACESDDVMKTQIVSKAIKTGLPQDEVAFELQALCAE